MTAEYLRERLRGLADEQFRVLYLNRRNALLEDVLIAQGSVDAVQPSLRIIVARALQVNASAHHVVNESGATSKRWKEFLENSDYGFRMVVGVSGTWLERSKISARYQFNMISPKNFNGFFQKLRDDDALEFRSDLNVAMTKAAKSGSS